MAYRFSGLVALAFSALLAGCGGGGEPAAADAAPAIVDANAAVAAADVQTLAFSLPPGYTLVRALETGGCATCNADKPVGATRGRLFTLDGALMADSGSAVTPSSAVLIGGDFNMGEFSHAAGVTPNGIAIGTKLDFEIGTERGFVHFSKTGLTQFLPANTQAQFVAENGVVGGLVCRESDCHAFHWSPAAPAALAEHAGFDAAWMNNGGTMVGRYQPAAGASRLATVDPGGVITSLPDFDPGPGLSAEPFYIADDGAVFVTVQGNEREFAAVIANGAVTRVGFGAVARPPVCGICDCIEGTSFSAFSATGHAVGMDRLRYQDKDGSWKLAAEAGFHWSARDGTVAVAVGTRAAIPMDVNAQGVVVGAIADNQEPFLWHRDVGGVRLAPLLGENDTPEGFATAAAIGDAGHLLISTFDPLDSEGGSRREFAPKPAQAGV